MSNLAVAIDEFTDPMCPWAWSAEPFRRRLRWLYGDAIDWTPRMVVLADDRAKQIEKGFTPEKFADHSREIARQHQMPIDARERPAVPASLPACRAVVAARENGGPVAGRSLLRTLRVLNWKGELIDEPEVIERAAREVSIDADLPAWLDSDGVDEALDADRAAARRPNAAARVLDHKLANWSGGRRYTCPSYEITRLEDEVTISVPGFQPFAVYDTILANLVPGVERRDPPDDVCSVLEWTAVPVSTQEVAVLCDIDFGLAHERLSRVADFEPVGADGFWTLPA